MSRTRLVCHTIFHLKESAFASWLLYLLYGNEFVCMTVAMHRTFRLCKSVHPFDLFNSQNLIKHGFHAFSRGDFISLAKMMNWEYKVKNEFISVHYNKHTQKKNHWSHLVMAQWWPSFRFRNFSSSINFANDLLWFRYIRMYGLYIYKLVVFLLARTTLSGKCEIL